MSHDERLAAVEEALMRIQADLEHLDDVVRSQAEAQAALQQRIEHLERRLQHSDDSNEDTGTAPDTSA